MADVNQLELAVLNLATNARDAMPDGGKIVISAQTEADPRSSRRLSLAPGRYVCLSVTDTGEGMDDATLASAMDPFFTTKGVGKGTGLGLSMVHGFIEQLGGRFILKSQKDVGTTAELWLPVALPTRPPNPLPRSTAMSPVPRLCVLVVDDDSLVLTSTCLLLEDLGHRVISAASGAQALELFDSEQRLDLVITDMAMPTDEWRATGAGYPDHKADTCRSSLPPVTPSAWKVSPPDFRACPNPLPNSIWWKSLPRP